MSANRQYNELDDERLAAYLMSLEECGMYIVAADACGIPYREIKDCRDQNPVFQEMCHDALERYRVRFIREAQTRALEGYEKPIIGGRNRDEVVATERVVSDRLLELFLKRGPHEERFTEKQELTVSGGVDLKKEFEFHKLSKKSRKALREALTVIKSENELAALTDGSTPGSDEGDDE